MPATVKKKNDKDENEKEPASDANYLVTYTKHLERRLKSLDAERQLLDTERSRLERELHALRTELDRLRQPPLIAATVIDVLEDKRAIVKSSTGPQFIVNMSKKLKIKKMIPGTRVALNQRTFAVVEDLPPSHDPFVKGMEIEENVPDVTYEDVGGLDAQLREIRETVELPVTHPELFEQVGITPPKGVLLWGLPGTGKTLIAKAVAHETQARFIRIIGSELVQKFIGEGARLVREVFQMAKDGGATIVFIDELDAIGSRRLEVATSGDREVQRTLMQLLSELDGFDSRGDVRILAATNRPDILDPALLRPGRFDRIIEFPKPDLNARTQIFKIHTRKINLADKNMDFKSLVQCTDNATGADIKAIATEAGMFAIRDTRTSVTYADFKKAIEKVMNKKILGDEPPAEIYR